MNLHFAADETYPQSFEDYDANRGIEVDENGEVQAGCEDLTLLSRVYSRDPEAIIDALRIISNFTFFNVPAMYRLDEMETILHNAAQLIHSACALDRWE